MAKFPQGQLDDIEPSVVHEIVCSLRQLHEMGKPKTDEEVANSVLFRKNKKGKIWGNQYQDAFGKRHYVYSWRLEPGNILLKPSGIACDSGRSLASQRCQLCTIFHISVKLLTSCMSFSPP